jgi:hypothetical protein
MASFYWLSDPIYWLSGPYDALAGSAFEIRQEEGELNLNASKNEA